MPELELLPEKTKRINLKPEKKSWIGISSLAIVLIIFGGLLFYNNNLETKIQDLDVAFINFNKERDREQEARIKEVDAKLTQIQSLLCSHIFWSEGFKKIQQLILPSITFNYLTASVPELKFEFRATAPNLTTIAKQGANFLADDSIDDISINQIKVLTTGQAEFAVRLTFNREKFFKQP